MTYEEDYSIPEEIMEQICEQGFDALGPLPKKLYIWVLC